MRSRALFDELMGACEGGMIATFQTLGITARAAIETGVYVGRQRVRPLTSAPTIYEPLDAVAGIHDAFDAIIVPVVEGGPRTYDGSVVVDLLAFDPSSPSRWWLRTGAGLVLGDYAIERADWLEEALDLYPDPLAWLRGECAGAVILNWQCAPCRLADVKTIIAQTCELGCRVEEALKRPAIDFPEIRIRTAA